MMHIAIDSVNVISVEIYIFLQWNKNTCPNQVDASKAEKIIYLNVLFSLVPKPLLSAVKQSHVI